GDVGVTVERRFPNRRDLLAVPVTGLVVNDFDVGVLGHDVAEALTTTLRTGVTLNAPRVDDLAAAAHLLDDFVHDRFRHEYVVGGDEAEDADFRKLIQRGNQRVHADEGDAVVDHRLNRLNQRANADGLNG